MTYSKRLGAIRDDLCAVLDDVIEERDALLPHDPHKAVVREVGRRIDRALDAIDKAMDRETQT